ncbi:sensor histidine kinase [Luteipulveratus sp. YIM 133132]|uniref:sensor histidine kinase n=1 Tax=Luteipulveratus flavus TaxID=3031728 RepID=UPI0023B08C42|nr:sensor histidine kinase [Luteipulveratus sp. YIM 133132]MDE9366641.1 sensor histidine kinase [Luteipulveratus sp. YIM 133132]
MSERQSRVQREEPTRRHARFAFAEWPLRRKLAAVLAIPVLLAATFAGLRINDSLDTYRSYSKAVDQAAVLRPALEYMAANEDVAEAVAYPNDKGKLKPAQQAYDSAQSALINAMDQHRLSDDQTAQLNQAIASGITLRNAQPGQDPVTVSGQIATITNGVISLSSSISRTRPDTALDSITDIATARYALADQRILVASRGGANLTPSARASLSGAIGREVGAVRNLSDAFGSSNSYVARLADNAGSRLTASANPTGDTSLMGADSSRNSYAALQNNLLTRADRTLSDGATNSRNDAIRDSVVTIAALLAALALALVVARMLLDPIRRVRRGALEVANERLPDAIERIKNGQEAPSTIRSIPVHTHEEMGQLARAVDDMHRQALRLATEQARLRTQVGNMFETLSRRSTSLVNQQLGLIESLERDEDDPQRLESLFKLDHLATRMRRNGDSLLVLAGATSRNSSPSDLPVSDTLRAALSEVQDYQRVRLDSIPEHMIRSNAASDMVHLFAEIIDNALAYSPPHTEVVLRGSRAGEGGVLIEIEDEGLGIAPDELDDINYSLESGADVTPDTARHMGLFVVSRLADAHDVTVDLRRGKDNGIIASVVLPSGMLVQRERREVTGPVQVGMGRNGRADAGRPDDDEDATLLSLAPATARSAPSEAPRRGATPMSSVAPAADTRTDSGARADSGFGPGTGPDDSDATLTSLRSGLPKRRPGATGAGQMGSLEMLRPVAGPHLGNGDGASSGGHDTAYDDTAAFLPRSPESTGSNGNGGAGSAYEDFRPSGSYDDLRSESAGSTSYEDLLSSAGGASSFSELLSPISSEPTDDNGEWTPTWTPSEDTFGNDEVWTPLSTEPLLPEPDSTSEFRVSPSNTSSFFSARSEFLDHPRETSSWDDLPGSDGSYQSSTYDDLPSSDSSYRSSTYEDFPSSDSSYRSSTYDDLPSSESTYRSSTYDSPSSDSSYGSSTYEDLPSSDSSYESSPFDDLPGADDSTESSPADTPIFGSMQSQWLTDDTSPGLPWSSSAVEAGWEAADRASDIGPVTHTTESGLPKRRPGQFLVPGAVAEPTRSSSDRDPAAIRDRLSRHLAGVQRGRGTLGGGTLGDDQSGSPEETGRA